MYSDMNCQIPYYTIYPEFKPATPQPYYIVTVSRIAVMDLPPLVVKELLLLQGVKQGPRFANFSPATAYCLNLKIMFHRLAI